LAAAFLATSQAISRDTFPPRQLGASQAIFALGAILGPALGPPIGGWLVDNFNWELGFLHQHRRGNDRDHSVADDTPGPNGSARDTN
jgi:hypothetical protein